MKRIVLIGSALLLVAAVLSIHLVTAGGTSARSGALTVGRGAVAPPGRFIQGDELADAHGRRKLAEAALAPLVGGGGPIGAPSPDGRLLAYNTWRWTKPIDWQRSLGQQGIETNDVLGMPRLRLLDLETGKERALEQGSFSISWRADGALAYVRGAPPPYRANTPYLRNVIVRPSADGPGEVWTREPERYVVDAWAGKTLIAERGVPGGTPDILGLDGPGSQRTIAAGAAFLGVSPDGNEILVATSLADTVEPAISIVDVASGRATASVKLSSAIDPVSGAAIELVSGPADWRGDRAVVSASSGLLVLRATSDRVDIEQVLHLDSAAQPNGVLYEPRFADDSTRTIVAWSDVPGTETNSQSVQFVCDRFALRCTRGAAVPSAEAPRPVYDESRGGQ
jgi:hypothetical protein